MTDAREQPELPWLFVVAVGLATAAMLLEFAVLVYRMPVIRPWYLQLAPIVLAPMVYILGATWRHIRGEAG